MSATDNAVWQTHPDDHYAEVVLRPFRAVVSWNRGGESPRWFVENYISGTGSFAYAHGNGCTSIGEAQEAATQVLAVALFIYGERIDEEEIPF